jgi:hypothetical protein
MLFSFGGRDMQGQLLFGMDINSMPWLWIPLLAIGDVVVLAVIALFFADRIRVSETRKKWGIVFIVWVFLRDVLPYLILFGLGDNFDTIIVGDYYSRRNMIEIGTLIALSTMIVIGIIWLVKTDKKSRKRGLYMIGIMLILMIVWSFGEWFSGQRWIEVGPEEGPWTLAPPLLQFGMFLYDIVIEMGLFTVCFLAVPYLLKLIKPEKQE